MKPIQQILDEINRRPLKAHYILQDDGPDPVIQAEDVSEWENTAAGIDTCMETHVSIIPCSAVGKNTTFFVTKRGMEELSRMFGGMADLSPSLWYIQFKGCSPFFTFAVDEIAAIERVKKFLFLGGKAPKIEGVKKVDHA